MPRKLPLYDPASTPATWSERMLPSEFAVHESTQRAATPHCTILPTLAEAEAFSAEQVQADPTTRCRIYDHNGFVGRPIREIVGAKFKSGEMSQRARRWLGLGLFVPGIALFCIDWAHDFRYSWPSLIGGRIMVPGGILLITELLIVVHTRERARRAITASR